MNGFTLPIALKLNDTLFGHIITYGYETPWASGRFEATDPAAWQRMIEVCELSEEIETWPEVDSLEAENQQWEDALRRRGLTQTDADLHSHGPWNLHSHVPPLNQPISPPMFDRQGFVTWRW